MKAYLTRYEALLAVRACFKTEQEMADRFEVSQPTVWRWLNQSKQLPPQHVITAEAISGVSRHVLRPDIYPVEVSHAPPAWQGVDRGEGRVSFQNGTISQRNNDLPPRDMGAAA